MLLQETNRVCRKSLADTVDLEKSQLRSAELANGRLAMMAIIGMFFQAVLGMQAT